MYKIIIVDDEMQAVNSIKEGMDWKSLNIESVHTAYNMKQAIQVFADQNIDIILCDIEMPKGNGIELLRWVRENKEDVECIFLTCHADFSYAKEAITLGSMDYLLKPVPFKELAETFKKAIKKIESKKEANRNKEYGILIHENRKRMLDLFYVDLLMGEISNESEQIKREAAKRKLELENEAYNLILFDIQKYGAHMVNWEKEIRLFSLKNILEEVFDSCNTAISVIYPREDCMLVIIKTSDSVQSDILVTLSTQYLEQSKLCLGSEIFSYIASNISLNHFREAYLKLNNMVRDNVTLEQKVITIEEIIIVSKVYISPNFNVWRLLLNQGDRNNLENEIDRYLLGSVKKGHVNFEFLEYFAQEYLQLLYSFLEEKRIPVKEVFQEDSIKQYYLKSVKSVYECIFLSKEMAKSLIEKVNESEQKMSRVEKAIQFIMNNLDQDITRETVANQLFLNPDYLNKIFKKDTGMTISDYLFNERMKLAQNLLTTTDLNVKDIAIHVGYGNFSHFAKMFQRYSGMTPKKYKKTMSK